MTPDTHTPTAMGAVYMHWNVDLPGPEATPPSTLPEITNILPGDTLVFTGASATITFPDDLMDGESGLAPGTFRVNALADDGSYTYHVAYPGQEAPPATGTVRIGLMR